MLRARARVHIGGHDDWSRVGLDDRNGGLCHEHTQMDGRGTRGRGRGASDRVAQMFDLRFVRMWRLYLAGSIAAFTTGTLQLFQVVFAPGSSNDVPLTRDYMYAR